MERLEGKEVKHSNQPIPMIPHDSAMPQIATVKGEEDSSLEAPLMRCKTTQVSYLQVEVIACYYGSCVFSWSCNP